MEYLSNAVMVTETLRFTGSRAVVRCPVIRVNVLQTCGAYEEQEAPSAAESAAGGVGVVGAGEEIAGAGDGRYAGRCESVLVFSFQKFGNKL